MTAYSYGPADPTDVVGRRIGAFVIDVVLMSAVALAVLTSMFLSRSEVVPASEYECVTTDDSSFDDGFGDDSGFSTEIEINSSFCIETGDDVRYIPPEEEDGFVLQAYGTAFGLQVLNFVILQGLTGASLGKLILGLRVVRADGRVANMGWILLRTVVLQIDALCCGLLPGLVLVFSTKGHRRLGDMASGTFVVRKESVGAPLQVPGVTTGYGGPGYPGTGGYGGAPGWPTPGPQQGWPGGGTPQGWPGAGTPQGWPAPDEPQGWPGADEQQGWPPAPVDQGQTGGWGAGTPGDAAQTPSDDGPTWDPARNAYIQYDRELEAWMQWDDDARAWRPISQ